MKDDFIRIENSGEKLHPVNTLAEYCFGKLSDDEWSDFLKENKKTYGLDLDFGVKAFKRAIDLGLTYQMSIDGCSEHNRI